VGYVFKRSRIIHFVDYFNIFYMFTMSNRALKFDVNLVHYVEQYTQSLLFTKHTFIENTKPFLMKIYVKKIHTNTHDSGMSPPIFSDALNLDTQTNDINDELNETDKETDDEDVICWSLIKQQITRLSEEKMDLEHFEKFYLKVLLVLREGHSLPQNIIQVITTGLKLLIKLIHELIKIQKPSSSLKFLNPKADLLVSIIYN
jgi:hypothetical protein